MGQRGSLDDDDDDDYGRDDDDLDDDDVDSNGCGGDSHTNTIIADDSGDNIHCVTILCNHERFVIYEKKGKAVRLVI